MQIVTDSGFDISPAQQTKFNLNTLPLKITLSGKNYLSGIDIQSEEFYQLLSETSDMPVTSFPSPGEFLDIYRRLAAEDPDILSIHISSGLSGTYNAAQTAAKEMGKEANITLVDTRTLSVEMGWQVEAAIQGIKSGWKTKEILSLMAHLREWSQVIFTLPDLTYLIHGGRISHLQGLLASVLDIKPLITVDKSQGKYQDIEKARTFKRAIKAIPEAIAKKFPEGTHICVQIAHAGNPEAAYRLRVETERLFKCDWLPDCSISPVLGAHTGRGLVGLVFAPIATGPEFP